MGVYIYVNIKINYKLLDSIPENTRDGISFYLYNYGIDPFYWNQRMLDIDLVKQNNTIELYNNHGLAYIYDDTVTLEQDGDETFLYKTSSGKPADSRIFLRAQSTNTAKVACSKCELEYESSDTCTLTLYLISTTIKVNIVNHVSSANIISVLPSSAISSINILNDQNDSVLNYTPVKTNNEFENSSKNISLDSNGISMALDRSEDDIFLYRANKNKPNSSVYRASMTSTMARYLSVERIKFTYVSDYEVDMDIYFTGSHGRIVEYYAIYSYTMLVPDTLADLDEEEEDDS